MIKLTKIFLATLLPFVLGACAHDQHVNACEGVTCSGRGDCIAQGSSPRCECDDGYYPSGLACLPDAADGDADGDVDGGVDGDGDADGGNVDADLEEDADVDPCVPGCDGGACAPGQWVTVCAGSFVMGAPVGETGSLEDEEQHEVTLTRNFLISTTEVTQAEFAALMLYNPSVFLSCGGSCPVNNLDWHEAAAYCNALSDAEGLDRCFSCVGSASEVACEPDGRFAAPYDCPGYRLPTEAEWEYAARASDRRATYNGELTDPDCSASVLNPIAWYSCNSSNAIHEVGALSPNSWGLYDMLGNVWEWCHDWHGDYSASPGLDPVGPASGIGRVQRGGSWYNPATNIRAAARSRNTPTNVNNRLGFRPVRTLAD